MSLNQSIKKYVNASNLLIKGYNHQDHYREVLICVRFIMGVDSPPKVTRLFYNEEIPFVEAYASKKNKPIIENSTVAARLFEHPYAHIPEDTYEIVADIMRDLRRKGDFQIRRWKIIQYN